MKQWVAGVGVGLLISIATIALSHHRVVRYIAPVRVGGIDHRPRSGELIDAINKDDLKKVTALLDRGVSPDSVVGDAENGGMTALSAAAGTGDIRIVLLLLHRGADVNAPDCWGGNAISSASARGYPDVVRLLIDHGGDVNADDDGVTALSSSECSLISAKRADRPRYGETIHLLKEAGASHGQMFGWLDWVPMF